MECNEFIEKMFDAYQRANGDLWKFWKILNPEAETVSRSTTEKRVFLYCNKRKNKTTGEEFIKRVIKIDDVCFNVEFRTATVPKFHGHIALLDYIIDEPQKEIYVYKFDFLSKPKDTKNDELDF